MKTLGGQGILVEMLEAMYNNDALAIDVNGSIGGIIKLSRGVKQGCILSPLLFNIFISSLGDLLDNCEGIPLGSTKVSGLLFADDPLILGEINEEIVEKMNMVQKWCQENKMEVNFGKTKILDKDKDRLWPVWDIEKNSSIESVKTFSYLGVPMTFQG